jgi:hypothetical protein
VLVDSFERLQINEDDDAAIAAALSESADQCDRPDCPDNLRYASEMSQNRSTVAVAVAPRRGVLADLLGFLAPSGTDEDSSSGFSPFAELQEERAARREEKQLQRRLAEFGLVRCQVAGDGNCQFRAIADQVYHSQRTHRVVRGLVIKELQTHPERYQQFIHHEFEAYVANMSVSGAWGDHITLQAAANSLNIAIHLLTSFPSDAQAHILVEPLSGAPVSEIWLSYIRQRHYDSLYNADSPSRPSPPSCLLA